MAPRGDHVTGRNGATDPGLRPEPSQPPVRTKPRKKQSRKRRKGLVTRTAARVVTK